MWRLAIGLLAVLSAYGGEKKLPAGEASADTVLIEASCLDSEHLKDIFGTDFDGTFVVVEVTLTPRGGQTLNVRLDDFLIRSEQHR